MASSNKLPVSFLNPWESLNPSDKEAIIPAATPEAPDDILVRSINVTLIPLDER